MYPEAPPYSEVDTKPSLQGADMPNAYPHQNPPPYMISPQQPGFAPTVTVVQQLFREVPCRIVCQFCNKECITRIKYKNGTLTWMSCLLMAFLLPLGCCFAPFCIKSCKDPVHYCTNCNKIVGRYNRM